MDRKTFLTLPFLALGSSLIAKTTQNNVPPQVVNEFGTTQYFRSPKDHLVIYFPKGVVSLPLVSNHITNLGFLLSDGKYKVQIFEPGMSYVFKPSQPINYVEVKRIKKNQQAVSRLLNLPGLYN